jgi:GINS complex subunit 4
MDIDDLLAEVAVDTTPQETRDLQELTRSWVAERVAPEMLPWPTELMERVLERIRRQVRVHQTPRGWAALKPKKQMCAGADESG